LFKPAITVHIAHALYINLYSKKESFVFYISLVFYSHSRCNSVRMSYWNKQLLIYLLYVCCIAAQTELVCIQVTKSTIGISNYNSNSKCML